MLYPHGDGNGIIFDTFSGNQYTNKSLVEGNLGFNNGASGMAVVKGGSYVTIRNNTFFNNHGDDNHVSTWRGEITIAAYSASSHDNTVANNIARARVGTGNYTRDNTAITDASGTLTNMNDVYLNNLTFDGTPGHASVNLQNTTATVTSTNGNLLGIDPKFTSETNFDFTLQSSSRAIDASTSAAGLPGFDLNGQARPLGAAVDLGAYEFAYSILINSIVLQGSNVLLTFSMGPGGTNALQANNGDALAGLNGNGFTNIFVVTSNLDAGAVTNFLDIGAVTNFRSRYYRACLVP